MDELGHLRRNEWDLCERGLEDIDLENGDIFLRAAESWAAVPEDQTWFEQPWIFGAIAAVVSSSVMTYVNGSERNTEIWVIEKRSSYGDSYLCFTNDSSIIAAFLQ